MSFFIPQILIFYFCFLVKSLPRFQISTLATTLGVRNIAFLGSGLLLINYVGSVVAALYMPQVNTSSFEP